MNLRQAFLVTALLAATPAQAAEYIITYEGTITSGSDQTGEFGAPGTDLGGLAFTAVYTLTAPLPGAYAYDDGTTAYIRGGDLYPLPSPVSGTLTINGVTQTVAGDNFGQAYQHNGWTGGGGYDYIYHDTRDADPDNGTDGTYYSNFFYVEFYSFVNNFLTTQDYTSPLTYTAQPGDLGGGHFQFLASTDFGNSNYRFAVGQFNPTSVTIAPVFPSAVPEPATWGMLIVGFGLVGGTMRRNRRRAAVRHMA